jgi:hypothetical protein
MVTQTCKNLGEAIQEQKELRSFGIRALLVMTQHKYVLKYDIPDFSLTKVGADE